MSRFEPGMSKEWLVTTGWVTVLVVLGGVLWFVIGPGSAAEDGPPIASESASGAPTLGRRPGPDKRTPRSATSSSRKDSSPRQRESGWIPRSAKEATRTSDLAADPDRDPLCRKPASLIQTGKDMVAPFERHLREATRLTDEQESEIGRSIEAELPRHEMFRGRWDRPEDVAKYGKYASAIVSMLAKQSKRPGLAYRVHVVRRSEFNAAAMPGGVMFVQTGLFESSDAVRDEAELVAVLAHEITHVEKRHTAAAYQYATELLGSPNDAAAIAVKMLTIPLSTEYEAEADDGGMVMLVEAQYNPLAQVNVWRRFAAGEAGGDRRSGPVGELLGGLDTLLRSHPQSARRACAAMKRVNWAREQARWERVYDGRSNLAVRITGPERAY